MKNEIKYLVITITIVTIIIIILLFKKSTEDSDKSTEDSDKSTEDSDKSTEDSDKSTEDSDKSTEDSDKSTEDSDKSTTSSIVPKSPSSENKISKEHNTNHDPHKVIIFHLVSLSDYNIYNNNPPTYTTSSNENNIHVYFNIQDENYGDRNLEKYRYLSTKEYHILSVEVSHIPQNIFINTRMFNEVIFTDKVDKIGNNSFAQCDIEKVTFENSITEIGDNAFAHNNITEVIIPTSLTKLKSSVFSNNKITKLTIPNNITSIGNYCFSENHIEELTLSESDRLETNKLTINDYAFYDNRIKTLSIPVNVTFGEFTPGVPLQAMDRIGEYCFSHNQIENLTIDSKDIQVIPYEAFSYNKLTDITFLNNTSIITLDSFAFKENRINDINIPTNITTINNDVFSYNAIETFTSFGNIKEFDSGVFNYGDKYLTSTSNINIDLKDINISYLCFANFKNKLIITNIGSNNNKNDNQFYNTDVTFN
jgi:hypothetical protein